MAHSKAKALIAPTPVFPGASTKHSTAPHDAPTYQIDSENISYHQYINFWFINFSCQHFKKHLLNSLYSTKQ